MKPPRIPSIFKQGRYNRHKEFEYKPRFYDEQKERLEKRRQEIQKEIEREKRLTAAGEQDLRERISESWSRRETRRQKKQSNTRILLILAILVLIIYYIYSKLP